MIQRNADRGPKQRENTVFCESIPRRPGLQLLVSFCGFFGCFSWPDGGNTVVIDYGEQRVNNSPRPTNNILGRYGNLCLFMERAMYSLPVCTCVLVMGTIGYGQVCPVHGRRHGEHCHEENPVQRSWEIRIASIQATTTPTTTTTRAPNSW